MAWRRIDDKLLSESMLTRFTDAYMRHYGRWVNVCWIKQQHWSTKAATLSMHCYYRYICDDVNTYTAQVYISNTDNKYYLIVQSIAKVLYYGVFNSGGLSLQHKNMDSYVVWMTGCHIYIMNARVYDTRILNDLLPQYYIVVFKEHLFIRTWISNNIHSFLYIYI